MIDRLGLYEILTDSAETARGEAAAAIDPRVSKGNFL